MEQVERASERLENIRSVKPILGGLRTISLGTWQAALTRRSGVQNYARHLEFMLPWLVPHLHTEPGIWSRAQDYLVPRIARLTGRASESGREAPPSRTKVVMIGSERGLCGRFNIAVADQLNRYVSNASTAGATMEVLVLGSRAQRTLERRGFDPIPAGALSMTTLPSLSLAFDLARRWLAAYEERQLDAVDVIYNQYRGTGTYQPTTMRLIPLQLAVDEVSLRHDVSERRAPGMESRVSSTTGHVVPPPIVDTDPLSLYSTVVEQSTAAALYNVLLNSAAAEHSTRFQLMESATQNADRLIEELTLTIQTARRHAITQEMQELAAGAGLLGRQ